MNYTQKQERLTKLDRVRNKIKTALLEIQKEEEVSISFGSTSYDMTMFSTKMTITETAQTIEVKENNLDKNAQLSRSYGFAGNIIGMKFKGGTITQFKTRNRKYPIIYSLGSRSYKTTLASVKSELQKDDILAYNKMLNRDLSLDKVGI